MLALAMVAATVRTLLATMLVIVAMCLSFLVQRAGAESSTSKRVALMDFSTDENSYQSIQKAAEFASLVQVQLMGETNVEWLERQQISLLKQESGLAGLKAAGGSSPLRQGRMLGADWLITGHFSSDDQSRANLLVQVIELGHADVIAQETVTLPDQGKGWARLEGEHVAFAAEAVRSLLAKARLRQQESTTQARVAFLFMADTSRWPESDRGTDLLLSGFSEALQRTAATNAGVRLIQFPKAYQSTDEAEMALDGIIEAGQDSWNRTADLYVWGTCAVTNARTMGRGEAWLNLELNLWDGVVEPATIKEAFKLPDRGNMPSVQAGELINRLVSQVISRARLQRSENDSTVVRKKIAGSIVRAYVAMTGRNSNPGLDEHEKFRQAIRMLETACYFDPDNADARVLWLTSRYGWWVDFGFRVKNEFWTKWRRSQAWGSYVDRFGLNPSQVKLPFPYDREGGIAEVYIRSLDDVIRMFPQWDSVAEALEDSADEDRSRRQGVHTVLMEAEYHGFPKQMPAELTMKWKFELRDELIQRKKRAAQAKVTNTNTPTARTLSRSNGAISNRASLPVKPVLPAGPASRPDSRVNTPKWLKDAMSIYGLFRLYPPSALANEIKPQVQAIKFPASFEVKVIRQLSYRNDRLWVLAMDERSALSSDAKPDLSGETLDERNRLWCVESEGLKPDLFKVDSLPATIDCFLFQGNQLWLAGESVGVLDLQKLMFRKFGLGDGLEVRDVEALAIVGGRVYAAGGAFKLSAFDAAASRWADVPITRQSRMSHGTGNPFLLAGHGQWLAYVAGSILIQNVVSGAWTNLSQVNSARCFAPDDSAFWIGADDGLHCYSADRPTLRSWNAPMFIESPMISLIGSGDTGGNGWLLKDQLERLDGQVRGRLKNLRDDRRKVHAARKDQKADVEPLRLNSRVPGQVAALVNDGEFIWLGVRNYFGSYLLLLHKPSLSLVASHKMGVRDNISSLAISDKYVWAGTAYGDNSLLRLPKDAFLTVPRSQWLPLAITPGERERLIGGMRPRDRALYAFYSADDRGVVDALSGLSPEKASLEEMFLLALSYDSLGLNQPQECRRWFDAIGERFPDSPWATAAREAMEESESRVDVTESRAKKIEKIISNQLQMLFKRYDGDGDQKLNRPEFAAFWGDLPAYFNFGPSVRAKRSQYDANKDSFVDTAELQVLVADLRKEQE